MIKGLRENDGRRVAVLEAEELVDDAFDDTSDVSIRIEQVQQHSDEDMAFGDFRRLNEHEVAKVHEVPPQLIGVMESANRSNSEEAIRDFVTEVVQPRQERFAGRLFRIIHQRILGVTDWTIEFNTKGARNEREEADIAATLIKSAGPAMTVNEVRELAGEEPLDTPMGQMLMSELSRGGTPAGGVGAVLEQAIDERVDEATGDLLDTMVTERRIEAGSRAD
jgi:capsid portal protein